VLPLALLGAVLVAAPGNGGAAPARPVVIVEDGYEVRRVVGSLVDGTFTPTQKEAEAPRRTLPRYLQAETAREKDRDRRDHLRQINGNLARYVWHCGGYTKAKERYLYCTFVSDWPESAARKEFPAIDDGGTSVCNLTYRLKTGKIVRIDWNGEA
jgi:hypothetical protein